MAKKKAAQSNSNTVNAIDLAAPTVVDSNVALTVASNASATAASNVPRELKPWSFLLYFCGDTQALKAEVAEDVGEVQSACESKLDHLHVVLQHDSPDGARRYVNSGSACWREPHCEGVPKNKQIPIRVNTGNQQEAIDFFRWGLKEAPSRHVAVFFSGQGIKQSYAKEICDQRNVFERDEKQPSNKAAFHERDLFSICHDESHHDALDVSEIRGILDAIKQQIGHPVDLVVFDAGCTAFVEIAYQLRDVANVMIAPRTLMPDSGLPYRDLLVECNKVVADRDSLVTTEKERDDYMRAIVERIGEVAKVAGAKEYDPPELVAIDLRHMEDTGQVMDYVASTLMTQLGDWHVLNAVRHCSATLDLLHACDTAVRKHGPEKGRSDMPTRDLFRMLCMLEMELDIESHKTPAAFGQLERLQQVQRVVRNARQSLVPIKFINRFLKNTHGLREGVNDPETMAQVLVELSKRRLSYPATAIKEWLKQVETRVARLRPLTSSRSTDETSIPVWIDSFGSDDTSLGLLILSPPVAGLDDESLSTARDSDKTRDADNALRSSANIIRESNYHKLDFCRDVCWTSLLGALQLIQEKPHALWRLVTTFLFSRIEILAPRHCRDFWRVIRCCRACRINSGGCEPTYRSCCRSTFKSQRLRRAITRTSAVSVEAEQIARSID